MTTTTVLHIPHSELRAVAVAYPAVALAFWRDTVADASILAKWVANVGRKRAISRTAHLFCELAVRMEQAGLGSRVSFPLPITQTELADVLGLTAVHVNRTLMALREQGIVRADQRTVVIQDWKRLAHLGEFDPEFLLLDEPTPELQAA